MWHERDNTRRGLTARLSLTAETGQIFREDGAALPAPSLVRRRGNCGGMRLPMVRKIKKWVPVCGNRWKNEVVDGREYHGLGVHYGIAPGGDMEPLRELPTAGGLCGLWGCPRGRPGLIFHQIRNRDSL